MTYDVSEFCVPVSPLTEDMEPGFLTVSSKYVTFSSIDICGAILISHASLTHGRDETIA